MSIGENIRRLRKEKGWSQRKLSELSGVSHTQIANYETNRTKPTLETIVKIANALDVNISELLDYQKFIDNSDWKYDLKKDPLVNELLNLFYCLNNNGKKKVIEHTEILTKVNEYKK